MARPAGVTVKTKDNSRKKHQQHAEWTKAKPLGRPKQRWVLDEPLAVSAGKQPSGHWEKVR